MRNMRSSFDEVLLQKIQNKIKWDIRLSNSDVFLKVADGVVHVYGYFDKPYRHSAAKSIITNTEGVTEFVDHSTTVYDYYRTDQELEGLIAKQIEKMELLPGEWIEVEVADGVVKIEGKVYRPRLKAFSAAAAWGLSGTKDCINLIEIAQPPLLLKTATLSKKDVEVPRVFAS